MRRVLSIAALLVAATAPVSAQDAAVPPEPTPSAPALVPAVGAAPLLLAPAETSAEGPAKPTFRLDLSSLPALQPNDYQLFIDPLYSTTAQMGLYGDYPSGARVGPYPPAVLALPTAIRWDVGPNAGFDLAMFSLKPKEWKDLDTWEKIGWVTTRASALAGLAVILGKLF